MLELTDATFKSAVLESPVPVLVDFWAPWCAPCRVQGPIVEQLASERTDVKIAKMNVDDEPQAASSFGIMAIPTIIIFKNGKPATTLVGLQTKAQIVAAILKLNLES